MKRKTKKELALNQFFTPNEIAEFMYLILDIKDESKVIDCAGGNGMLLERFKNVTCWDIEKQEINRINSEDIIIIDSIEAYDRETEEYDIALANPPFSKANKWAGDINNMHNYELGHKWKFNKIKNKWVKTDKIIKQYLGILFIERNIKLVRDGGIIEIILPNGYLTNPSNAYIREFILKECRIIGLISLPDNVFKRSGAGGLTVLLILRKEKNISENYNIFTSTVNKIGFNHVSKHLSPIYLRDHKTGIYMLDEKGEKIADNDLVAVITEFQSFIANNKIEAFKSNDMNKYDYTTRDKIMEDRKNLVLCPKRSASKYNNLITTIMNSQFTTLSQIKAKVTNKKDIDIIDSNEYTYLDIGEVFADSYKTNNKLMGWELPNRASLKVKKYDILISKLAGSSDKFTMIFKDNEKIVATNGFWRIRIEDVKQRLNFYHYLFSEDFRTQMTALATGTIMADIKEDDLINNLKIPIQSHDKLLNLDRLITLKETIY